MIKLEFQFNHYLVLELNNIHFRFFKIFYFLIQALILKNLSFLLEDYPLHHLFLRYMKIHSIFKFR